MIDSIIKRNRRAQSHIEVVIAFVIFITFLIFIFTLFNPFKKQINPEFANSVFNKIRENTSTILSSVSINLNTSSMTNVTSNILTWSCIAIPPIEGFDCSGTKKLVVKKSNDEIVSGFIDSVDGNKIKFEQEKDITKTFYTFYCEENLTENHGGFVPSTCMALTKEKNYSLGIVVSRDLFSGDKIKVFNDSYTRNYFNIKSTFVPSTNDFGVVIVTENELVLNATRKIPRGINVDSQITPIDIVGKDAEIKKATINIFVW
ncbi:MAG: hypothetical protein WC796_05535 [Candidatus Pacearchaeota archaeon]|jgi:hypothetical protein